MACLKLHEKSTALRVVYTTTPTAKTHTTKGYTGHEHLQSVGLIHMNGRVYDPLLRRFLGPDNFVQDPFNTQNFNRYGYVLNNPLVYTDPSGEFFTWSIGKGGFSIGLNFSPIGIPLGFGINIGWEGGFSIGAYGEVGWRFGGFFNATVSVSCGYNFGTGSFSVTVGANVSASLGPLFIGGGVNTTFVNGQTINSWGASVGIGFQDKYGRGSLGLSAGYGSGGFTYGLNGSYNSPRAREMTAKYQQVQQQVTENKRLQRLEAQGKVRGLTEGEIELAKSIFGDKIDYSQTKVIKAKYFFLQGKKYLMTPNGNIYDPLSIPDYTQSEYTNNDGYFDPMKTDFLHEMTHVYQYQQGLNVFFRAGLLQIIKFASLTLIDPYKISNPYKSWNSYNLEQQGTYVENVFNNRPNYPNKIFP